MKAGKALQRRKINSASGNLQTEQIRMDIPQEDEQDCNVTLLILLWYIKEHHQYTSLFFFKWTLIFYLYTRNHQQKNGVSTIKEGTPPQN